MFKNDSKLSKIQKCRVKYESVHTSFNSPGTNPQMALVISNPLCFSKELIFK